MNRFTLALRRPFIWLSRFRHRCGYGVHSPFAFDLITGVIYQHTPYYKYAELTEMQKRLARGQSREWAHAESRKLKRLLFRLVNHAQPHTLVDAGQPTAAALYLKAGKEQTDYTAAADLSELFLEAGVPVDFLYLHDYRRPEFVKEVFHLCAARTTPASLFVIHGIRYTPAMYRLWQQMQQDEQVGITFDLYDVGLIFFDRLKQKQHYIINF